MSINHEIFIKGCASESGAICAMMVTSNGRETYSGGKKFEGAIQTKEGVIELIPFKEQYQMELYALAWGLVFCERGTHVDVYTNNKAIQSWVNNMHVPEDYQNIFHFVTKYAKDKEIVAHHVKKGENQNIELCNLIAHNEG